MQHSYLPLMLLSAFPLLYGLLYSLTFSSAIMAVTKTTELSSLEGTIIIGNDGMFLCSSLCISV